MTNLRSRNFLVSESDSKIILSLEGECLFRPSFRPGGEYRGLNCAHLGVVLGFRSVRYLDIVRTDIRNFDILGLELPAKAGAMKGGTEDSSFIGVYIDSDFRAKRGVR